MACHTPIDVFMHMSIRRFGEIRLAAIEYMRERQENR